MLGALVHDDLAVGSVGPRGARALRCRRRGVKWSTPPKTASVGHTSAMVVERLGECGPAPVLGHADHPVERDRAVEPLGGRGLERVHAAHAEAHHRDLARRRRAPRRSRPRPRGRRAAARRRAGARTPSAPSDRSAARTSAGARVNGSGQHTAKPLRREPATQVVEQRTDAHDVGVQRDATDGHRLRDARGSPPPPRRRRRAA